MSTSPPKGRPAADDPLLWLLTLEMARQRGDFQKAAAAQKELSRLGVRVSYARRGRKAVADAR
jgi:hypothetical protein